MKKFGWKFALIIGSTIIGLVAMLPPREKLKLGIDLSGGTILVYEANRLPAGTKMDELIAALKQRVNPEGVLDIPIRKIGSNRVEIILPEASPEDVEEVKQRLTDVGSLEFRILANLKHDRAAVERARRAKTLTDLPDRYAWAQVGEVDTGVNPQYEPKVDPLKITDTGHQWKKQMFAGLPIELTGRDAGGKAETEIATIAKNSTNTIELASAPKKLKSITNYKIDYNPSNIVDSDDTVVREEQEKPGLVKKYILYVKPKAWQNVTGKELARVYTTTDTQLQPAVGFDFNSKGGRAFGNLTREHLPEEDGFKYRLAILLDDLVKSAPSIEDEIRDQGIIKGVRPNEIDHLVAILQSGSLPASLNPTPLQEEKIGPTLGEDTINKGVRAIVISMLVVPLFMIVYYRFAGVVAVFALVLNMILLLGSMAFFKATFTLPGLAGLALTIGMGVDANVLIFERMREEKERGASMAQQIRNGFSRAWVTIFDSNVCNTLSALVLYMVGTEEVKGFALTLIIGLLWNLFTAVYASRVIFEFWHQKGWLKNGLTMMKLFDKTNIDFIGPRKILMTTSLVVILLGLVACFMRGKTMLNIDFTGGTLVTISLNDQDPKVKALPAADRVAYVRERANVLKDVTVESLNVEGEQRGIRFNIRTTEQDMKKVQNQIRAAFGTALAPMTIGPESPVPKAAETKFPKGEQFELRFNTPQPPTRIASAFGAVLGGNHPESQFEVINPAVPPDRAEEVESKTLVLRTNMKPDEARQKLQALQTSLASNPNMLFERIENFGGTVAGETQNLAMIAIVASWLIIIAYLWFRFKSLTYGLAAVIALVHDVLITLGAVAVAYWIALVPGLRDILMIEPFKIDLPMIAAFLTLIGFSVNDTIVIFDRIREIRGKMTYLTPQIINDAVNQTLSRTILTSLTAWIVVVILYIFGGEGLHGFSFCLVVGFLSGTYSTIYIASPILIDWAGKKPDQTTERKGALAASR
ncbi:MAG TPA: protein translocase subunit SecD [Isosphaeraceae bacterium]|jgi:SecD/SecF fusion protein|nr:protein translocase subunit SecD [Isosphaeraceae bacterium]